jgi:hypothetical protein
LNLARAHTSNGLLQGGDCILRVKVLQFRLQLLSSAWEQRQPHANLYAAADIRIATAYDPLRESDFETLAAQQQPDDCELAVNP